MISVVRVKVFWVFDKVVKREVWGEETKVVKCCLSVNMSRGSLYLLTEMITFAMLSKIDKHVKSFVLQKQELYLVWFNIFI